MFESAELGHKIEKETFKAEEPKLRAALLETQCAAPRRRTRIAPA